MAPGSEQILHRNADPDGFFFTSLFTKFIPIRNRIGKHCTAFKNQFCLPFGHCLESTSQQSATCTAWNPSWVASCIPVWRWGSLKLWHRAVLADRGVQATHLLEQKATSHQSWQRLNLLPLLQKHSTRKRKKQLKLLDFPHSSPLAPAISQISNRKVYLK